jgi:hypothetical protein
MMHRYVVIEIVANMAMVDVLPYNHYSVQFLNIQLLLLQHHQQHPSVLASNDLLDVPFAIYNIGFQLKKAVLPKSKKTRSFKTMQQQAKIDRCASTAA